MKLNKLFNFGALKERCANLCFFSLSLAGGQGLLWPYMVMGCFSLGFKQDSVSRGLRSTKSLIISWLILGGVAYLEWGVLRYDFEVCANLKGHDNYG